MGAQPSNWIREYIDRCTETAADCARPIEIRMLDGELDGRLFQGNLWDLPPERLYAGDLEPYAVGSYLLESCDGATLVYRCRVDDDYVRLRGGKLRLTVHMARERLLRPK